MFDSVTDQATQQTAIKHSQLIFLRLSFGSWDFNPDSRDEIETESSYSALPNFIYSNFTSARFVWEGMNLKFVNIKGKRDNIRRKSD